MGGAYNGILKKEKAKAKIIKQYPFSILKLLPL